VFFFLKKLRKNSVNVGFRELANYHSIYSGIHDPEMDMGYEFRWEYIDENK
jgi:hypothetical protein